MVVTLITKSVTVHVQFASVAGLTPSKSTLFPLLEGSFLSSGVEWLTIGHHSVSIHMTAPCNMTWVGAWTILDNLRQSELVHYVYVLNNVLVHINECILCAKNEPVLQYPQTLYIPICGTNDASVIHIRVSLDYTLLIIFEKKKIYNARMQATPSVP